MRTGALLSITVLMLAGCSRPLPDPVAPRPYVPPPPATEFLVREARLADGMVSVRLDIPLTPAGPKPTVIALIGDTHQLVGAGFVAVTYSINWGLLKEPTPGTGAEEALVGKWVLASPSADVLGEAYLRNIVDTATNYVPQIVDWLAGAPEVDASRLGMIGGSTNGFITLQATAADRRIRAAVAIAACGDFHRFLRDSSMGMQGAPLSLAPSYSGWIRDQELIHHPQRIVHAALLMVNRAGDELIPVGCADATAKVLSAAYSRAGVAEKFRYLRLDESGHGMGTVEGREALAWLQQWLQPAQADR